MSSRRRADRAAPEYYYLVHDNPKLGRVKWQARSYKTVAGAARTARHIIEAGETTAISVVRNGGGEMAKVSLDALGRVWTDLTVAGSLLL